ncbi:flavin-containing monooxygenase FMO GS-OX5-like [Tetranychus urticae]|uniref:flavin-containing monooxygenase FMO GS-OX5-like n=1 Tax=Tetranychus urticae TaxID=32264 RepID=UPI00077B8E65|nr:flavin-containing monooxygenase FMO GS-OX5-like [Tetranychus urticae]
MNGNGIKRRSVAIIGAGPGGLILAHKFLQRKDLFDVTVFEKQADVGGTWIYCEDTEPNKYGLPVHSSIYRNLRTNLPIATMEFDDFPHNQNPSKYVSHQQVLKYLQDFAHHFAIKKYTKFLHLVTKVSRDDDLWFVDYRNLETQESFTETFDVVCICQGRFSVPYIPNHIPGLNTFKGLKIHTHTYRVPDIFKNKRVAVLGGGPSGADIALEVADVASETYLCHTVPKNGNFYPFGDKIIQTGAIFKSVGEDSIELTNGTVLRNIDAIIFATGYQIDLSIIDPSCGIEGGEGRVDGLFMHMININYPTMAYLGLMERIPVFNVFSQMAKYFVRTLTGEAELPSKDEMILDLEADRKERQSLNRKMKHSHRMFCDEMWRYDEKLSILGRFKPLSPLTKALYDKCLALFEGETNYKDYQFILNYDKGTYVALKKMTMKLD